MTPDEVRDKLLHIMYQLWFDEHRGHFSFYGRDLLPSVEPNIVEIQFRLLQSRGCIKKYSNGSGFLITAYGISEYEKDNPNSDMEDERKKILDYLKIEYEKNVDSYVSKDDILHNVFKNNPPSKKHYLLSQIKYLSDIYKVDLESYLGGDFHVKLSIGGYESYL